MTIGYLHVGASTHGVVRYGRVLAAAARDQLGAAVLEAEVELAGTEAADAERLQAAARQLAAADVVHLQYNERVWGNARSAANMQAFVDACPVPVVATLHDVRRGYGWGSIGRRVWAKRTAGRDERAGGETGVAEDDPGSRLGAWWASLQRGARYVWKEWQNTRATRLLARRAGRVLVCTQEEARRLQGLVPAERLDVVPHFVEARAIDMAPTTAKGALGLEGRRVCTVLGFIHRKKGHALVVEALPAWSADVQVVFAGRAAHGSEGFVEQLHARAEALGVADRLRVTGYLSEETLNRYLAATDLALCPFEQISASGSLSTWIAAERPILASDQPQIAEYNAMASGAIATFSPYTPAALATAAQDQLQGKAEAGRAARAALREKLSLPRVIQQHARVYRAVTGQNTGASSQHQSQ